MLMRMYNYWQHGTPQWICMFPGIYKKIYVRETENDHHHQNPLIFGHFFVVGAMFLRYNCFVVGFLIQSSARLDAMGGPVVARVGYWWPRVRDVDVVQAIATSFEFSEV